LKLSKQNISAFKMHWFPFGKLVLMGKQIIKINETKKSQCYIKIVTILWTSRFKKYNLCSEIEISKKK